MILDEAIHQHARDAVDLRHRLHQVPELMYEEFETARVIRDALDALNIPHIDNVLNAPTATIAVIGDAHKPCIALRADIDALPIAERTGAPYASQHAGRMHACGHDGHSAILVAAAGVLRSIAGELDVCVKLIWQPAEEGGAGALRLVNAGVLDGTLGPKVQAIFGLHGWPGLPLGAISTKPGPLLAATDSFTITFVGKGCHGAFPHLGADPIVAAAEAVVNLQQCVARDLDPTEPGVVTIGMFHAGTATNVIPDEAVIRGTARSLSDHARHTLKTRIAQRCAAIAGAGRCTLRFDWTDGYPATINDPAMTAYVETCARTALGPTRFIPAARAAMGGEDFAYYAQNVPACFFFIGVDPITGHPAPPLHSDQYNFPDACLEPGVRMFTELSRSFAREHNLSG